MGQNSVGPHFLLQIYVPGRGGGWRSRSLGNRSPWLEILLRRRRALTTQLLADVPPSHVLVLDLEGVVRRKPASLSVADSLALQPACNVDRQHRQ